MLGVVHRNENEGSHCVSDISFLISDFKFAVAISDRSNDTELSSNRYVDPEWVVDIGGDRKESLPQLLNLYNGIAEYHCPKSPVNRFFLYQYSLDLSHSLITWKLP